MGKGREDEEGWGGEGVGGAHSTLLTPCSSILATHLAQGDGLHIKEVVVLPAEVRV